MSPFRLLRTRRVRPLFWTQLLGTFLAILGGTLAGTWLPRPWVTGLILVVALLGYLQARRVPAAPGDPAVRVRWNLAAATAHSLRSARAERPVWLTILAISWFWGVGALLLGQLPAIASELMGGGPELVGLQLAACSVGIGAGSLLCERLSAGKVELALVPLGCLGLAAAGADLFFALRALPSPQPSPGVALNAAGAIGSTPHLRVLLDLSLLGLSGGLYIVPLQALLQQRGPRGGVSRLIAASNVVNAAFMVAAAGFAVALRAAGLDIAGIVLVVAAANALIALRIYHLVPEYVVRFIIAALVHVMYRVRRTGLSNLPEEGPAVIVCNHVSFVDAPIIAAMSRRPVRFVMDHRIFRTPLLGYVFRTGKAIPIAPARENPELMEQAFDDIAAALDAGEIVCIFPEGQLTRDGELGPFRRGVERILERNPVPVVPMALRGLWGSFFSRAGGRPMSRPPRRFLSRIEVVCDRPLPAPTVSADTLRGQVLSLRGARL